MLNLAKNQFGIGMQAYSLLEWQWGNDGRNFEAKSAKERKIGI